MNIKRNDSGVYIVLEGGPGAGKTTQLNLLKEWLPQQFLDKEIIFTREPGGNQVAEEIRRVVQEIKYEKDPNLVTEVYLYAAARSESLREIVKPALERGAIVVADRSVFSSVAYQGYGRGLNVDLVWRINESAVEGLFPDRVFYFNLDPEIGLARQNQDLAEQDRLDMLALDFHRRVREGYLQMAKNDPEIFRIIDASGPIETVAEILRSEIRILVQKQDESKKELKLPGPERW